MKRIFNILAIALLAVACDDTVGDSPNATYSPQVNVALPDSLAAGTVQSEKFEVRNVSTGRTTTFSSRQDLKLTVGLYDVTYEAEVLLADSLHHVTAYTQSVEVTANRQEINLQAFESLVNDDFIISEIFFSGTLQPSGNQYYGDDYVKIYNNTDHVLYADGLTLVESQFLTTQKYNYTPDIMDQAMTVQAIYTIPGSGKDHPVQPGEELILADTGIDHRVANPNSFDLSKADFEWYDVSSQPAHMDIDSPTVPNLDKWYCYTLSFFVLHNRGFRAYALARIPIDKEEYLKNYRYTYDYTIIVEAGTFPMSRTAYKLPNKWIVDAVNCSVAAKYVWNVTTPSLDRGWTYCGTVDKDKTRYFHSVRRKMLYLKDGKPYLQDTNNSSADFNPECIASEIERQGTAIDVSGTKCTTRTYDGVTPMK